MELSLEISYHLVEASFPMWKHGKEERTDIGPAEPLKKLTSVPS